jgi:hypothetical protein
VASGTKSNGFVYDFFRALGVDLENDGIVRSGYLRTAQGIAQHVGQAGVAMATLIITLRTFSHLWCQRPYTLRFAWIVVVVLWLFLILFIAISTTIYEEPPFYAPTPVSPVPVPYVVGFERSRN